MKKRRAAPGISDKVVDNKRGIGLIITVVAAGLLFGVLALTFDLGRIYIAQNELQTYTDAAVLAATPELDGTNEGVTRALTIAESYLIVGFLGHRRYRILRSPLHNSSTGPGWNPPPLRRRAIDLSEL